MIDSAQQRAASASSSGPTQSFTSLARSVLNAAGSAVGAAANTVVGTEKPRGPGKETIFLVPGWGVKRPTKDGNELGKSD